MAIDRTNSKVLYVGGSLGGVWKTTNGGNSWTPLTDFQPTLATGAIAVDPSNPNIVYVGTGDPNSHGYNYFGAGILKSTNGGSSFAQLAADTFEGLSVAKLIIDPVNPAILYAGTARGFSGGHGHVPPPRRASFGIYKSVDGGVHWVRLTGAPAGDVRDVKMHPTSSNVIYATFDFSDEGGGASGIYRTADGGQSWVPMGGTGLPATGFGRISMAIAPSAPETLYAAFESTAFGADLLNIFKTTNAGASWSAMSRPVSGFGAPKICTCDFTNVLSISPTDPNIVFFGGASLYRSTNGGSSWIDMTRQSQTGSNVGGMQGDVLAIEFDPSNPSHVIVGSDGGIFASVDTGNSWLGGLNSNLSLSQFYSIAVAPGDDGHILGGSQDKGVLLRRSATVWDYVSYGDGGEMQIDPVTPTTLYHPDISLSFERSDDDGRTWQTKETGLVKTDRFRFNVNPLAIDPMNPHTLYLGSQRLYRTTNRGDSWSPISGDLTNGGFNETISAVAIGKASASTIYVGTSDGNLQVTTNGGSTFSNLNSGLPQRFISRIVVDSANSQTAYCAVSSFHTGHIFKTTNTGGLWSDISGNLPDVPVNALAVDPLNSNHLYAGTDAGVFVTTDGGTNWTVAGGNSLPHSPVFDVKISSATHAVFAATFGRGIFMLASGSVGGDPPGPPRNLTASTGATTVSLLWDQPLSGGAVSSYIIEAGSSSGLMDLAAFDTGNVATTFTASSVSAGTYYVRVRSRGLGGLSAPSSEVVFRLGATCTGGQLSAPSGLSSTVVGDTVDLTWRAPNSGTVSSYIIEAGSSVGLSNIVSNDTGSVNTSLMARGVAAGMYFVRVKATNACGLSGASNEVVITVGQVPRIPLVG